MIKDLPYENIFKQDFLIKSLSNKLLNKLPQEKIALLEDFRFRSITYVDHAKARKRLSDGTFLGAQRLLNGGYRIIKKGPEWLNYTQRDLQSPSINIETASFLQQFHWYSNQELLEIIDLLQIVSQKLFIISYTEKTIYYNKELWQAIKNISAKKEKQALKKLFYLEAINSILKENETIGEELIKSRYYNNYTKIKNSIGISV